MKKLTFESVLKRALYKDRNAIYDLVPPEGLIGRIKERNDMVMELSPILLGSPVSSVFVYAIFPPFGDMTGCFPEDNTLSLVPSELTKTT